MNIKQISNFVLMKIPLCFFGILMLYALNISHANISSDSNGQLILCALFAILILAFLDSVIKSNKSSSIKTIGRLTAFFCILEIWICFEIFFQTGWDVWTIDKAARLMNHDLAYFDWLSIYFSIYPNNILLTFIYSICLKINAYVGILYPENGIMIFVTLNCVVTAVAAFCLFRVADRLLGKRIAIGVWVIFEIMIGLSPWNVIPYSDLLAASIPCFILYLYYFCPVRFLTWCGICILGITGYHLKPQSIIVFIGIIAVVIYETLLNILQQKSIHKAIQELDKKKVLLATSGLLLGCICANLIYGAVENKFTSYIEIDEELRFPMTHWFMMGLNEETDGLYSLDDVDFSSSFDTVKDRTTANLQVAKQRIQKFGASGLIKHIGKKFALSMADGNFSWSTCLGDFYSTTYEPANKLAVFLKNIFWLNGGHFSQYSILRQFIWIGILLLNLLQMFDKGSIDEELIMVTFIGVMLFEALFETSARHIISNFSIMLLGASYGYKNVCTFFTVLRERGIRK